jgi:spermidine synthase
LSIDNPKLLKRLFITTAFLEGVSVLVVEIAGARALAPFYGSSLKVWTAQITATLLFLALGYWFGGLLSKKPRDLTLPAVFLSAGAWLVLFPILRIAVLETTAGMLGISIGSFASAVILYGVPLMALGAVSPLLIERLERLGTGAGHAAGTLFFTNTIGGLTGGWLTALWLIPNFPLRLVLTGTGIILIVISTFWGAALKGTKPVAAGLVLVVAIVVTLAVPAPARTFYLYGARATLLYTKGSNLGLIQVLDMPDIATRSLLLDGAIQGGQMRGVSAYPFTEYQNYLAFRYHPRAKSALVLGLGAGILAKELVSRGLVDVTAVELEPDIGKVAREYFGLPRQVRLIYEDARTYLNRTAEHYDLVFLDVYAGESIPWYLTTLEAMELIKRALNPGGRLIINTMTWATGSSPDLERLESGLVHTFDQARVFIGSEPAGPKGHEVTNAILVAGSDLSPTPERFPGYVLPWIRPELESIERTMRPARADVEPCTDDWNDLDYLGSDLKLAWRSIVIKELGAKILGD